MMNFRVKREYFCIENYKRLVRTRKRMRELDARSVREKVEDKKTKL